MATPTDSSQPLADLATYLFNRRNAILDKWRTRCEQDPTLAHVATLSREEFNNLMPLLLTILDQRLHAQPEEADPVEVASAHGLHRWHKGRSLRELMTELDYLYQLLTDELRLYRQLRPDADLTILLTASEQIARLKSETLAGSATEYEAQQQLAAANRSVGLQQALDQLNQLGRDRTDLLRASSHDLKGTFGVIQGATFLLNQEGQTDEERSQLIEMVNRNLSGVRAMLTQLTDLARLEAGQEQLTIDAFDVSQLLRELVGVVQPLAAEKRLVLWADGPDTLPVRSDAVKIRRIVQNLLLNAILHTSTGTISVSWSREGNYRWYVSIQDSGPGLSADLTSVLMRQFKPLPEPSTVLNSKADDDFAHIPSTEAPSPSDQSTTLAGEGIGLHIVKQLCDLLGANIDVETSLSGTLVRIRMAVEQTVQAE